MRVSVFLFLIPLLFLSCESDVMLKRQIVGNYKVTLESAKIQDQIEHKTAEIKRKTTEAKKKVEESIEIEKSNIDKNAPFAEGLISLLDGIKKVTNEAADLGEALGSLTLNLSKNLIDFSVARLELNNDGTGHFGTEYWGTKLHWKVENGQLYLWGANRDVSNEVEGMIIEKIDADNFDLIGDDVRIHLERVENDK